MRLKKATSEPALYASSNLLKMRQSDTNLRVQHHHDLLRSKSKDRIPTIQVSQLIKNQPWKENKPL
jgi:hypothetical protein